MSEVVREAQDFWRPPAASSVGPHPSMVEICDRCRAEFMVGARFCHTCGAPRRAQAATPNPGWLHYLQFHTIREWTRLSTGSLVFFLIGVGCALCALGVGFVFSAQNLVDWQAVQLWRIQWLLAAGTAFLAAILLKRSASERD